MAQRSANDWKKLLIFLAVAPTTFEANFSPFDGGYATEIALADQFSIGPLVLTNVPVAQAIPSIVDRWGARYAAGLGLAALKQLNLVVDGPNHLAYVSVRRRNLLRSYPHNRLEAVFVPTPGHTNQFVARVADGSPASEATIRDGDLLLRIGDLQVTTLKAQSWTSPDPFYQSAGTKLKLTLSRDGHTFTTTAILRDILQAAPRDRK